MSGKLLKLKVMGAFSAMEAVPAIALFERPTNELELVESPTVLGYIVLKIANWMFAVASALPDLKN